MTQIRDLLEANGRCADSRGRVGDSRPTRHLAIITCMDARIDVFAVLGLRLGEAHVLRNAGGRVTEDVLRSLAVSVHGFGVDTVIVMQHTRCGLAGVTDDELRRTTGADLGFLPIEHHESALRDDISLLSTTDYLAPVTSIAGFVYDVDTGAIDLLVDWERTAAADATDETELR